MPETEFENAPMSEERDMEEYGKFTLDRPKCNPNCTQALVGINHDSDCPKFEDNSHAPDYPV